jgi:hypothetical protein
MQACFPPCAGSARRAARHRDEQQSDIEGLSGTRRIDMRTGTGTGGTHAGLAGTSAGTMAGPLSTALPGIAAPPTDPRPDIWRGPLVGTPTAGPPPRDPDANRRFAPSTAPPQGSPSVTEAQPKTGGFSGPAAVTAIESMPDRVASSPRIVEVDNGFGVPIAPTPSLAWKAPLDPSRFGPPTQSDPVIHTSDQLPDLRPSPPPASRDGAAAPAAVDIPRRSAGRQPAASPPSRSPPERLLETSPEPGVVRATATS